MKKIKILFYPEGERYLYEMAPIINEIAKIHKVYLLLKNEEYKLVKNPNPYEKEEIIDKVIVIKDNYENASELKIVESIEKFIKKISFFNSERILNSLPIVILISIFELIRLIKIKISANEIYQKLKPNILIVARDRHIGLSLALIKKMNSMGQYTFLIPWGFVNISFLIANRINDRRNQLGIKETSLVQKILLFKRSKHIINFENKYYSYLKPSKTLAAFLSNLYPKNPWVFGSEVKICLIDNLESKKILINNGIKKEKIIITGNQIHDTLFNAKNNKLKSKKFFKEKYNLQKNKIFVIALPHLAEHKLMSWEQHWNEIEYMIKSFKHNKNYNIILSLHPRCSKDLYEKKLAYLNVPISSEPLKSLLPISDYFACQWSGTTTWGVLLNIPTLVMNWFGISNLGYEFIESKVLIVNKKSELSDSIKYLIRNKKIYKNQNDFCAFDGKSTQRVINEILKIRR